MENILRYGCHWIDDDDIEAVVRVLKSDYLTQGPVVEEFEQAICRYTGAKYCVVVANGTAALHLAVDALKIEIGCEGITSPNSFVASANCLAYNRLKPVFADIEPDTYNISPDEIERRIGLKTHVIIPVHFAGQPADMERIGRIAKKHGLSVIEDAAHAIGSRYGDGSRVGACLHSDMTTFSFHPVKTITSGEGGAVTTNNEKLYRALLLSRSHGITKNKSLLHRDEGPWYYEMQELGFNYRMTDIQAALGMSQLSKIGRFIDARREIVSRYNAAFAGLDWCRTPYETPGVTSAFHLYVLRINYESLGKTRKQLMEQLSLKGVGSQVHYIPIHLQLYYRDHYGYVRGDFPKAEEYYEEALSIPLYPRMSHGDVEHVIESVLEAGG